MAYSLFWSADDRILIASWDSEQFIVSADALNACVYGKFKCDGAMQSSESASARVPWASTPVRWR